MDLFDVIGDWVTPLIIVAVFVTSVLKNLFSDIKAQEGNTTEKSQQDGQPIIVEDYDARQSTARNNPSTTDAELKSKIEAIKKSLQDREGGSSLRSRVNDTEQPTIMQADDSDDFDLGLNLEDPDEVRRAFIYSEILQRKY